MLPVPRTCYILYSLLLTAASSPVGWPRTEKETFKEKLRVQTSVTEAELKQRAREAASLFTSAQPRDSRFFLLHKGKRTALQAALPCKLRQPHHD